MIDCPHVQPHRIREHYNLATVFYRLLWGPHIHHGLWHADESPRQAQIQLTRTLWERSGMQPGARVLDVGCGMGGSAMYLARQEKCQVTGITVSALQSRWATWSGHWQGVGRRVQFLCEDAEKVDFPPGRFDGIWSVECTEHFFDKPAFFRRAANWLRPGGRVAICAWLAGDQYGNLDHRRQVQAVCDGFFCPSLGTTADYSRWMEESGIQVVTTEDWTRRVEQTWEICKHRVRLTGMPYLARLVHQDSVRFLDRFDAILTAYRSGAMKYGCFVGQKPG